MMCFKFDEDKVIACINAYYEEHGKYPYIITNSKTKEYFPPDNISLMIIGDTFTNSSDNITSWHNAKILIDESLKFGELYIK